MLGKGVVLQERYRIEDVLGHGGMGAVYRAADLHRAGVSVAIKEMTVELDDPRMRSQCVSQFYHEGALLSSLSHPGLVPVSCVFEDGHHFYLVMACIEGETLEDRLQHETPAVSQVIDWTLALCDVLTYLHEHEPPILFRDLKPSNIMVAPDGGLTLIDFGLVRLFEADAKTNTFLRGMATEGFAPLEQYASGGTDVRTDVYSLGATLYYLLTLQPPPSALDLVTKRQPLRVLHEVNPEIAPALDDVVHRMMYPQKKGRYASMREATAAFCAATERVPLERAPVRSAAPVFPTTRLEPRRVAGQFGFIWSVAATPDGRVVALAAGSRIVLWDVLRRSLIHELPGDAGIVRSVAFSPDGARLASVGTDSPLVVWDWLRARPGRPMKAQSEERTSLSWSPDGTALVAVGPDVPALQWRVSTGACRALSKSTVGSRSVSFSSDGACLALDAGTQVRVLDARTGATKAELPTESTVRAVAWSKAGSHIAAGTVDGSLYLWSWPSGHPTMWRAHPEEVSSLAWAADGTLATGSLDHSVRLWSQSGELRETLPHAMQVNGLTCPPGGEWLAVAAGTEVLIWPERPFAEAPAAAIVAGPEVETSWWASTVAAAERWLSKPPRESL